MPFLSSASLGAMTRSATRSPSASPARIYIIDVADAGLYRSPHNVVVDQLVNPWLAVENPQGCLGNGERVLGHIGDDHRIDGYPGQQIMVRIIDDGGHFTDGPCI